MRVRLAVDADAEMAARIMRRSISRLCTADHRCNPKIVTAWLANKRPDVFRVWLAGPENCIVVAESEDGRLIGVGGCNRDGEITLNYVAPEARRSRVSTTLVAALELQLADWGIGVATLTSTLTARQFYLHRGYEDVGPPQVGFAGMIAQPMKKALLAGSDPTVATDSAMKYCDGDTVELGDKVELAGRAGQVLAIIHEDKFSARAPRDVWNYLRLGAVLDVDGYGTLHYEVTEDDEDLVLVSRGEVEK